VALEVDDGCYNADTVPVRFRLLEAKGRISGKTSQFSEEGNIIADT
jgi:hypothetical protein